MQKCTQFILTFSLQLQYFLLGNAQSETQNCKYLLCLYIPRCTSVLSFFTLNNEKVMGVTVVVLLIRSRLYN